MVAQRIRQAVEFAKKAQSFVLKDMWAASMAGEGWIISWAVRILKMSFLVYKNLREKRFFLRAHALTYWTLISIVPALAVTVIVLKGLGGSTQAEENFWPHVETLLAPAAHLAQTPKGEPADKAKEGDVASAPSAAEGNQAKMLVGKIREFVDNIDTRAIGAAGMTVAILTVISLLTKIEQGFNDIWDIERKRTFVTRVITYWGVMSLPAVLLVMSSGMNIVSKSEAILGKFRGGASLLHSDDVQAWPSLCAKVAKEGKEQQGLGARVWGLLDSDAQRAVELAAGGGPVGKGLQSQVLEALNVLVDQPDLHTEKCLGKLVLPPEAKNLVGPDPTTLPKSKVRRLNRLLLATCYPGEIAEGSDGNPVVANLARGFVRYLFVWTAFALLYKIMPNARVHTRSAVVAAIVAGTLWQLSNYGYGLYLSWTSGRWAVYTVVYGSLAAVPIFLMWVYLSWAIVLFGAGVAYADQNLAVFEREGISLRSSFAAQQFVAIRACIAIGQAYHYRTGLLSTKALSFALCVPIRIVNDCVKDLRELGYLTEVLGENENEEATYEPATSLVNFTLSDLADGLRRRGGGRFPMPQDKAKEALDDAFRRIQEATERELGDTTLLDVVVQAGPLPVPDPNKPALPTPDGTGQSEDERKADEATEAKPSA